VKRFEVEKRYVNEIAAVIELLADELKPLLALIGEPRLVGQPGHEHFMFDSPDARTITVLMLVRIASGLQGCRSDRSVLQRILFLRFWRWPIPC